MNERRAPDGRGQSEVIGVVLLLAITIIGASAVVAVGSSVFADSRHAADLNRAEHAMTQLDSRASLVALGETPHTAVSSWQRRQWRGCGTPNHGRIRIYHETGSGERTILNDRPLGAVVYRSDDTEIAYQGGGSGANEEGTAR